MLKITAPPPPPLMESVTRHFFNVDLNPGDLAYGLASLSVSILAESQRSSQTARSHSSYTVGSSSMENMIIQNTQIYIHESYIRFFTFFFAEMAISRAQLQWRCILYVLISRYIFSIELIGNAQYDLKAIFWINRGILPFNSKISYSGAPSLI